MNIEKRCKCEIEKIKKNHSFRSIVCVAGSGGRLSNHHNEILNFTSNDYLDLANNSCLKNCSLKAIKKHGTSSASARLLGGSFAIHDKLEKKLAKFIGYESALLFGSGYLANLGTISTLAGKDDIVFSDRLIHSSIIDGIKLSGASHRRFRHNDIEHLKTMLEKNKPEQAKFIITESVFSMDGDLAPLDKICEVARQFNAFLIVDEAHALGIYGQSGAGISNSLNIKPDLIIGTLGKSFASYGGFVACSQAIKDFLINKARTFIFSTSLPPANVASAFAAIRINQKHNLGKILLDNAAYFRNKLATAGISTMKSCSQIVPVLIGDNEKAVSISKSFKDIGIYVKAITPPAVPTGTTRLRFSITTAHSKKNLKFVAESLNSMINGEKL